MNPKRRSAGGVGMAAGAVFAAALIGLAHAPAATADTDLDPFQDLFGTAGINTWTTTADTDLAALSPTLADGFDTSVENWQTGFYTLGGAVTFTELANVLDPSAFSVGAVGVEGSVLLPDNAIGDLATGLDYALFASGLGSLDFDILVLLGPLFVVPA